MASKKLGTMIKDARTAADLTQEKLAKKIGGGLTANDISKVEHGEADLTQEQLKKIAKATGVTQASLLNAAKGTTAKKTTVKKTTTAKKTTSTAKSGTSTGSSMKVSTTERKLVEYYRDATSDQKKAAISLLKGESNDFVNTILTASSGSSSSAASSLGDMLGDALKNLLGK